MMYFQSLNIVLSGVVLLAVLLAGVVLLGIRYAATRIWSRIRALEGRSDIHESSVGRQLLRLETLLDKAVPRAVFESEAAGTHARMILLERMVGRELLRTADSASPSAATLSIRGESGR